jgi:hypothetical protein
VVVVTGRQRLGLVLLTLALIAGGIAVTFASSAPTATGQINVTATLVKAHGVPIGRPGRQSDLILQSWRINDRVGTVIGRMVQQCRWVTRIARLCLGELALPRGKIMFQGSSPSRFDGEYAVTGGTGAYQSAGGVMLYTAIGLRKTVLLITVEE